MPDPTTVQPLVDAAGLGWLGGPIAFVVGLKMVLDRAWPGNKTKEAGAGATDLCPIRDDPETKTLLREMCGLLQRLVEGQERAEQQILAARLDIARKGNP